MPTERTRWFVDLGVTVVIVATCVALLWANWDRIVPPSPRTIEPPTELVSIADAPIKGDPEAAFVLIEYSDYQCPYCARFESEILPGIEAAYIRAGRLRLAFRHHPIETLHPFAPRAAAAAVCSGEQGRFWEYHELLFANVRKLDDTVLRELAVSADLDAPAFLRCLEGEEAPNRVRREGEQARAFGLTGTPAFLVGEIQPDGLVKARAVISGALPPAEFAARLDAALDGEGPHGGGQTLLWGAGLLAMLGLAGVWTRRRRRLRLLPS